MGNKFLFKVQNTGVASSPSNLHPAGAPVLVPSGGGTTLIDVVNEFPWTNTPKSARFDVPKIVLKEYHVTRSSLYQQARYLFNATTDVVKAIEEASKQLGVLGSLGVGFASGLLTAGPGKRTIGGLIGTLAALAVETGVATKAANAATAFTNFDSNQKLKPYLQPYNGLYDTASTGFRYEMPYFTKDWKEVRESWNALNDTNYNKFDATLQDIGEFYHEGGLGGFTGAGALRAYFPAAYIESPKSFRFGDGSQDTKFFEFTLFNTTNFDDVVRNWQLCFLLMYQNRPNRNSKVLLDVPAIYEVSIPGIYYCPFAFLNSIQVEQLGGTRIMSIPIQTNSGEDFQPHTVQTPVGAKQASVRKVGETPNTTTEASFTTIIPDAYNIKISFTPLVSETKNLLYHALTQNDSVYDVNIIQPPSTPPK